jgi:polysaccharide export outer membrane protein
MKKIGIYTFCLLVMIAIGIGESQAAEKKTATQTWSAKGSAGDYSIGIGDMLKITTWKEPELSMEEVLVRTDGQISFPLVNDVQAAGLSPVDLKRSIEAGLKDYVSNPVVTVHIISPNSQRIYVLGEVVKTGEYPLVKHLTVLQAFALAGGFTQWASKDEIILLRSENGKEKIYRIDYKDITKGKDLSQNLKLQADDTIIVP